MTNQTGNFSGLTVANANNLAVPMYGGTVGVIYTTLTFADAAVAKTVGTLRAGAIIVGITVDVKIVFNSSGTDLLDIGTSASAAAYKDDLSVAALGQTVTGWTIGTLFSQVTSDTVVTATYAQSVADATTGSLVVAVFYIML